MDWHAGHFDGDVLCSSGSNLKTTGQCVQQQAVAGRIFGYPAVSNGLGVGFFIGHSLLKKWYGYIKNPAIAGFLYGFQTGI